MVPATTLLHRTNVLGRRRRAATKEEANRRQADSFLAELCRCFKQQLPSATRRNDAMIIDVARATLPEWPLVHLPLLSFS